MIETAAIGIATEANAIIIAGVDAIRIVEAVETRFANRVVDLDHVIAIDASASADRVRAIGEEGARVRTIVSGIATIATTGTRDARKETNRREEEIPLRESKGRKLKWKREKFLPIRGARNEKVLLNLFFFCEFACDVDVSCEKNQKI